MSKLELELIKMANKVLDGKEEKLGDYIDPTKQQILTHYIAYEEVERLINDIGEEIEQDPIMDVSSAYGGLHSLRSRLKAALKKRRESK